LFPPIWGTPRFSQKKAGNRRHLQKGEFQRRKLLSNGGSQKCVKFENSSVTIRIGAFLNTKIWFHPNFLMKRRRGNPKIRRRIPKNSYKNKLKRGGF